MAQKAMVNSRSLRYDLLAVLGEGSYGKAFKGVNKDTNELITVKIMTVDSQHTTANQEIKILKMLTKHQHPNCLQLLFEWREVVSLEDAKKIIPKAKLPENAKEATLAYLVYPYSHYTLSEICSSEDIDDSYKMLYAYQLFKGLGYLKSLGICHRDIKPANIVIDPFSKALKIIDFGSAKVLKNGEKNNPLVCTLPYRAPELLMDSTTYTFSIDMWAAGCVLAEMYLGQPLIYSENSEIHQYIQIMRLLGTPSDVDIVQMVGSSNEYETYSNHPTSAKLPQLISIMDKVLAPLVARGDTGKAAAELVKDILQYDPASRPTPYKACAHAYFKTLRDWQGLYNRDLPLFVFNEMETAAMRKEGLTDLILPPLSLNVPGEGKSSWDEDDINSLNLFW